jgi:hypothetical protein
MRNKDDWSPVDLEAIPPDAVPVTIFKPIGDRSRYDRDYTAWAEAEAVRPARSFYRLAWRTMAANTGERTFMPTIIPPGTAHVDGVQSLARPNRNHEVLPVLLAIGMSLIADFVIRSVPKSAIRAASVNRLPWFSPERRVREALTLRALRLTCVTSAYAQLWRDCYTPAFADDAWVGGMEHIRRSPLGSVGPDWDSNTPIRIAFYRRQAQVEIDALVALALSLNADELCAIYRAQFAVLYDYDHGDHTYDLNGRLVPNSVLTVWRKKGDRISEEERTATNQAGNTYTYELPFVTLDREADMRQAYAHFERLLAERS